ncbi:hypothetical protein N7523_007755 [Penicillium sp. IBT 18751x]|nr:hypothetical protein N7523_007755 [Penicillium sp. IBT 18751x]
MEQRLQERRGDKRWARYYLDSSGLTSEVIETVYEASCFTYYGLHDEAELSYAQLEEQATHPLIAILRSTLYADMGLAQLRLDSLQKCKNPFDHGTNTGCNIWDLVVLLRATADGERNGKGRGAMNVTLAVIGRLTEKDVENYDHIEVHIQFNQ